MIEIKNRYTNKVMYSVEAKTVKEAVEKLVKEGANLKNTNVSMFLFQQHQAIYTPGGTIRIGCESHKLDYWLKNYKKIGKKHNYSKEEIEAYGDWIKSFSSFKQRFFSLFR